MHHRQEKLKEFGIIETKDECHLNVSTAPIRSIQGPLLLQKYRSKNILVWHLHINFLYLFASSLLQGHFHLGIVHISESDDSYWPSFHPFCFRDEMTTYMAANPKKRSIMQTFLDEIDPQSDDKDDQKDDKDDEGIENLH